MENNHIDLIIPCYNPSNENWAETVVLSFFELTELINIPLHLILVNDGSTKNITVKDIDYIKNKINNFKYFSYNKNRGKGYALRHGAKQSVSEYIVFTDIDFPYTTESVANTINSLTNYDVVLGYRTLSYYNRVPLFRKIISKTLRYFLKNIMKFPITDTQCGLKGFNKKGKAIFLSTQTNRFLFDLEFVSLALKKKSNIHTLNVNLKEGIVFSRVNLKTLFIECVNLLKIFFVTKSK